MLCLAGAVVKTMVFAFHGNSFEIVTDGEASREGLLRPIS